MDHPRSKTRSLRATKPITQRGRNCGNSFELLQQLILLDMHLCQPRLHLVAALSNTSSAACEGHPSVFRRQA